MIDDLKLKLKIDKGSMILNGAIRTDKRLNANLKLFYALIYWVVNIQGYDYISNSELGVLIDNPVKTIEKWISDLKRFDLIDSELINYRRKLTTLADDIKVKSKTKALDKSAYYTLIPNPVFNAISISSDEKILYSEILGLTRAHGYCYADIKTLALMTDTTIKTCYRYLANLMDKDFVRKGKSKNGLSVLFVRISNNRNHEFIRTPKAPKLHKDNKTVLKGQPITESQKGVLDELWRAIKV